MFLVANGKKPINKFQDSLSRLNLSGVVKEVWFVVKEIEQLSFFILRGRRKRGNKQSHGPIPRRQASIIHLCS